MHIRTFRAANLNDALRLIREQMGPDATVLHTRQAATGAMRLWRRNCIEVTAGLSNNRLSVEDTIGNRPVPDVPKNDRLVPQLANAGVEDDGFCNQLLALGIPPDVAEDWQRYSFNGRIERRVERLRSWLAAQIPLADPIDLREGKRRVVALVGATGVGKTTTIAKLAGQFRIDQHSKVGLLTVDAFRAAAVEQLDAFAAALRVPLEVVRELNQVEQAMDRLADVDLLLVDTVGQSPRQQKGLDRLKELLDAIVPDETYLVLDANASHITARDSLRSFASLSPTSLILSKVDEVSTAAPTIVAVMQWNERTAVGVSALTCDAKTPMDKRSHASLPRHLGFSYVTNGQSVPQDVALADCSHLATLASGLALETTGSVMSTA